MDGGGLCHRSDSTAMPKRSFLRSVGSAASAVPITRALHSSTFQLNVSAFCGIGVALRGWVGGV